MVGSLSGGIWLVVCPVVYVSGSLSGGICVGSLSGGIWLVQIVRWYMVGSLSGGIWLVVCPVVYGW